MGRERWVDRNRDGGGAVMIMDWTEELGGYERIELWGEEEQDGNRDD